MLSHGSELRHSRVYLTPCLEHGRVVVAVLVEDSLASLRDRWSSVAYILVLWLVALECGGEAPLHC